MLHLKRKNIVFPFTFECYLSLKITQFYHFNVMIISLTLKKTVR